MSNVAQFTSDEPPTKPCEPFPSRVLVLAARIDRLAELAAERLACAPDEEALAAACADLAQIRAIAGELR